MILTGYLRLGHISSVLGKINKYHPYPAADSSIGTGLVYKVKVSGVLGIKAKAVCRSLWVGFTILFQPLFFEKLVYMECLIFCALKTYQHLV